jgi:hypothetical protein
MKESELVYKNYIIRIVPQDITGDNTKVFFRVLKNNDTAFIMWVYTSATESRGKNLVDIYKHLVAFGTKLAKKMIDNHDFTKGSVYNEFVGFH